MTTSQTLKLVKIDFMDVEVVHKATKATLKFIVATLHLKNVNNRF